MSDSLEQQIDALGRTINESFDAIIAQRNEARAKADALAAENDRLRAMVQCLLDTDPDDMAAPSSRRPSVPPSECEETTR